MPPSSGAPSSFRSPPLVRERGAVSWSFVSGLLGLLLSLLLLLCLVIFSPVFLVLRCVGFVKRKSRRWQFNRTWAVFSLLNILYQRWTKLTSLQIYNAKVSFLSKSFSFSKLSRDYAQPFSVIFFTHFSLLYQNIHRFSCKMNRIGRNLQEKDWRKTIHFYALIWISAISVCALITGPWTSLEVQKPRSCF